MATGYIREIKEIKEDYYLGDLGFLFNQKKQEHEFRNSQESYLGDRMNSISDFDVNERILNKLKEERFRIEQLVPTILNLSSKIKNVKIKPVQLNDLQIKDDSGYTLELSNSNFNFFIVLTLSIKWSMTSVIERLSNELKNEYEKLKNNTNPTNNDVDSYNQFRKYISQDIEKAKSQHGKIETLNIKFPYNTFNNVEFIHQINLFINDVHGNEYIGKYTIVD